MHNRDVSRIKAIRSTAPCDLDWKKLQNTVKEIKHAKLRILLQKYLMQHNWNSRNTCQTINATSRK